MSGKRFHLSRDDWPVGFHRVAWGPVRSRSKPMWARAELRIRNVAALRLPGRRRLGALTESERCGAGEQVFAGGKLIFGIQANSNRDNQTGSKLRIYSFLLSRYD